MKKLILAGIIFLMLTGIGAASPAKPVRDGVFEEPCIGENTEFIECPDAVIEYRQSINLSQTGNGYVSQSVSTTALNSYTLSFEMAGNPECSPYEKLLLVHWGNLPAYGPYSYSVTTSGKWVTIMLDDLPGTDGETQLTFEDVSDPSSACGVALDNIRVMTKASVPFPELPTLKLPLGLIFSFS
jgi:hypothetical protein